MSEYPVLPKNTKCIRVVDILPGQGHEPSGMYLEFVPEPVNIATDEISPCYEALSYVWGDENHNVDVKLKSQGNVGTLSVTKNLFEALLHLRHEDKARTMWIDAICIRQTDNDEKKHQVALMGDVYRKATGVVAWLGPSMNNSDRALQVIEETGNRVSLHWEAGGFSEIYSQADARAMCELLGRPWFERLWVRQEISLGTESEKDATVQCGTARASWRALARTVAYLRLNWWRTSYINGWNHHFDRLTFVLAMCDATKSGYALFDLQKGTKGAKCKDPKDKIYGIIQICPDLQTLGIEANYDRGSVEEVYRNVTREYISQFKRLDILATCFFVDNEDNRQIPSWVPNWHSYDSRGDIPEWAWPIPDSYFAVQDITLNQDHEDPLLHLRGKTIGSIKHVWNLYGAGAHWRYMTHMFHIWKDGLKPMYNRGQTTYPDEGSLVEAFCRTLYLGHVDNMQGMRHNQGVEPFWGYMKAQLETEKRDWILPRFLAAPTAIRNIHRRFFITDTGKMGTGPNTTQPGDKVVAFLGSGVPFIINQSHDAESGVEGDHRYRLRGACYVDGAMAQEPFLELLPEGTCKDCVHSQFCHNQSEQPRKEWTDPRLENFKPSMGVDHKEGEGGQQPTRLLTTPEQWRSLGVELEEFTIE